MSGKTWNICDRYSDRKEKGCPVCDGIEAEKCSCKGAYRQCDLIKTETGWKPIQGEQDSKYLPA